MASPSQSRRRTVAGRTTDAQRTHGRKLADIRHHHHHHQTKYLEWPI